MIRTHKALIVCPKCGNKILVALYPKHESTCGKPPAPMRPTDEASDAYDKAMKGI